MVTATLDAEPEGTVVRFTLTVENDSEDPLELSFPDGQRAEFLAQRGGETVWRWSEGQMFMQMLGSETVEPGETVTYEGVWESPESGTYDCRGEVVAEGHGIDAETTVSI
ncbi:Intracellular proteinase inhibitor [Halogranum amylolyticum]|uniref:Intracellular proteinase inhibitor n=1 Tax=Halogranum amylolyticum TaxID=660520 RepID=A0A1H8SEF6_9EURY|nr:BsuPI-related putative proteinase inhibitor [Halogranum amylolyticum]SEO76937.1 Intracellular proteinase inhibitor [Halogranum amylolyticum]